MTAAASWCWLSLVFVTCLTVALGSVPLSLPHASTGSRERRCCRYASDEASEESGLCPWGSDACVVRDKTGKLTSPPLDICNVQLDSKKDKTKDPTSCLDMDFSGDSGIWQKRGFTRLPFSLHAYTFADKDSPGLSMSAVELRIDYNGSWSDAKFRIVDDDLCGTNDGGPVDPSCNPRCVEILKNHNATNSTGQLLYDCEVGFYTKQDDASVKGSAGHAYRLGVCLDFHDDKVPLDQAPVDCAEFYFVMPEIGRVGPIILLDRGALENEGIVEAHIPEGFVDSLSKESVHIAVRASGETLLVSDALSANDTNGPSRMLSFREADLDLSPGLYDLTVELGDILGEPDDFLIARFSVGDPDKRGSPTGGMLVLTLVLFLVAGGVFYVSRRYKQVKASVVLPNKMLEAGRVGGKSVFVITNVDNRHHIEVVMLFNKYLKAHCAVTEVFFALDPVTGLSSEPEQNPWKWAVGVAEKIEHSGDGCLVFVAAPPQDMGAPMYKDLPNNQVFNLGAKYLKNMVDENRVAILHFPYSDPATVPTLLPPDVRAKPYNMPEGMNGFLCQLLDVKKRELCRCLPMPIVQPQVAPQDFLRHAGGKELLTAVDSLSGLVAHHKATMAEVEAKGQLLQQQQEQSQQPQSSSGGIFYHSLTSNTGSSTLSRTEETTSILSDSEDRSLLRASGSSNDDADESKVGKMKKKSGPTLEVEMEPSVLSLRGAAAAVRDRSIHPEFQNDP